MSAEDENEAFIAETKAAIAARGAGSLRVTDLTAADLSHVWWTGSPSFLLGLAATLERVKTGELAYLAVRAPDDIPVAVGGIDYVKHAGAGMLYQLNTHWSLQSLGIGSHLIAEAENRIARRGLSRAVIGVEDHNVRAQALYERLGYRVFGHERDSWEVEGDDGATRVHVTECTLLEKRLRLGTGSASVFWLRPSVSVTTPRPWDSARFRLSAWHAAWVWPASRSSRKGA